MQSYFAYIRVSTVKQGEKGVSLQEQREAITRYTQKFGFEIAEWFEERETAAKRGRPVFTKMLRLLQKGKASGVVIHKIDRSARNLRDWAEIGELIDSGISVHFANEGLDLYSRGGRLSADIQAVVAADYIRNLREEVKKGFYGRLKQGLYPLPAPLGYLNMGQAVPKKPDPEMAPLIKRVFELYSSGYLSLLELTEEAYHLGLRTRKGRKVSKNGIAYILSNPFYLGLIRIRNNNDFFQGIHEPIITKALFDRVQDVLSGKAVNGVHRHDYLFRRSLTCKHCHRSLIGERQKGRVYYRCHIKTCPRICLREDEIEASFETKLSKLTFTKQEERAWAQLIAEGKAGSLAETEALKTSLALRIGKTKERINRLTDAFLDNLIDREMFNQRKQDLMLERKDLEVNLTKIEGEKSALWDEVEKKLELAKTAYLNYKIGNLPQKREILKSLTSNCLVDGKNVDFTWYFPYKILLERAEFSNGGPYRDRHRTFEKVVDQILGLKNDSSDEWT